MPPQKFDPEQPRPPRNSNILVTQALAILPPPGLEPGPVASVSKTLPLEQVQTCPEPRPPKRLFKATQRLSFEQDDQKPSPVGNAKAKKMPFVSEFD